MPSHTHTPLTVPLDGLTVTHGAHNVETFLRSHRATLGSPAMLDGNLVRNVAFPHQHPPSRPIRLPGGITYELLPPSADPATAATLNTNLNQAAIHGYTRITYLFVPDNPGEAFFTLNTGKLGQHTNRSPSGSTRDRIPGRVSGYLAATPTAAASLTPEPHSHPVTPPVLLLAIAAATGVFPRTANTVSRVGLLINNETLITGFWSAMDVILTRAQLVARHGFQPDDIATTSPSDYTRRIHKNTEAFIHHLTEASRTLDQIQADTAKLAARTASARQAQSPERLIRDLFDQYLATVEHQPFYRRFDRIRIDH